MAPITKNTKPKIIHMLLDDGGVDAAGGSVGFAAGDCADGYDDCATGGYDDWVGADGA